MNRLRRFYFGERRVAEERIAVEEDALKAIEALENLNKIAGSRKVGVISHVVTLRDKILTHIEVVRNGHDPSVVKVVDRGEVVV